MSNDPPANFFKLLESLDDFDRRAVESAWSTISFGAGQVVYEQASAADDVFIVVSGAVEAITFSPDRRQSRVIAVMGPGDFFGDLAIFTDQPRLATIRTRETTQVHRITRDAFLGLLKKLPELGLFFCRNLGRRLHNTATEAHHGVYAIDLTGNLQRFDLLTIVQAITSMGHTGELHLNNSANQLLGSFFFRHGRVEHARFGQLLGVEAIWQGFIESASEGTFNFRSVTEPTLPFPAGHKIDVDSTNLLLQGVGKRDTYQAMPKTLREMKGNLTRMADTFEWKDPETRPLAEKVWALISAKPELLDQVWKKLNCSAISFLEVVMEMGMSGQAELFVAPEELEEP